MLPCFNNSCGDLELNLDKMVMGNFQCTEASTEEKTPVSTTKTYILLLHKEVDPARQAFILIYHDYCSCQKHNALIFTDD